MSQQSTYTVLTPEAHVRYHDGKIAADYACIGIVEASDPDEAVTKAVETVSPMTTDLAEDSEFLVFEVAGDRYYERYSAETTEASKPV